MKRNKQWIEFEEDEFDNDALSDYLEGIADERKKRERKRLQLIGNIKVNIGYESSVS